MGISLRELVIIRLRRKTRENDFISLTENANDIITRIDRDLRHIYVNPAIERITGVPPAAFIGKTWQEMGLHNQPLWDERIREVFATGAAADIESYYDNGAHKVYYQAHLIPEIGPHQEVLSVLTITRDITKLKLAEEALRLSEAKNRAFLDALPDLMFHLDKGGTFLSYKAPLEALFLPPEQFIGRTVMDILPSDLAVLTMQKILQALATGQIQIYEYELPINGENRYYEARLVPFNETEIIFIIRDMTEKRQIELELSRLDRLYTVGEMAASLGHEVRNPMTTVHGFLQIMCTKPDCRQYHDYFKLMIAEIERANAIICEFLALAKNKLINPVSINLNQTITSLAPLIEANAIYKGKSLELQLTPIPPVQCDDKEIRQLLLNLARNGLEAMPDGGRLTISSGTNNQKVFVSVKDEGSGIDPLVVDRIGTPFLTTKETGTGLGLPICYTIAKRNKATLSFQTSRSGTVFSVEFDEFQA